MTTAVAFSLGLIIGWIVARLFRRPAKKSKLPAPPPLHLLATSFLIVCALVWATRQGAIGQIVLCLVLGSLVAIAMAASYLALGSADSDTKRKSLRSFWTTLCSRLAKAASGIRPAVPIAAALILAGVALVITFLYGTDDAVDWPIVIWLSQPTRLWAALGLSVGLCAGFNHDLASEKTAEFYAALLGSGEGSSWALQAVVGVLVLVLVIEVINPSLVDHLTEFHAGQFEAKFGEVSSETRDTVRLSLTGFDLTTRMSKWVKFADSLCPTQPRGMAETEFDKTDKDIKKYRQFVRNLFFVDLNPLVTIVSQLENENRNEEFRSDPALNKFIAGLRAAVELDSKDLDSVDWKDFTSRVQQSIAALKEKLKDDSQENKQSIAAGFKGCIEYVENTTEEDWKKDAQYFSEYTRRTKALLADDDQTRPFSPAWLDPYVIAVEADLIAITASQTEKANFLLEAERRYPDDEDHISPGLINLHYQIADAMYKSEGRWPLEKKIQETKKSLSQTELYIGKSKNSNLPTVTNLYRINKIIFSSLLLEIINGEGLSGAKIEPALHREWTQTYAFMEQVLETKAKDAGTHIVEADFSTIPSSDKNLWAAAYDEVLPAFRFDGFVGMSLAATMLTSQRGHATAVGCETAYFYLSKAEGELPQFEQDNSVGERLQLKGYLSQVKTRIDAGCT